jgi:hypothetical protein
MQDSVHSQDEENLTLKFVIYIKYVNKLKHERHNMDNKQLISLIILFTSNRS